MGGRDAGQNNIGTVLNDYLHILSPRCHSGAQKVVSVMVVIGDDSLNAWGTASSQTRSYDAFRDFLKHIILWHFFGGDSAAGDNNRQPVGRSRFGAGGE
jgi:hypothetical protein